MTADEALQILADEFYGCSPDIDGVEATDLLRETLAAAHGAVNATSRKSRGLYMEALRRALDGERLSCT